MNYRYKRFLIVVLVGAMGASTACGDNPGSENGQNGAEEEENQDPNQNPEEDQEEGPG